MSRRFLRRRGANFVGLLLISAGFAVFLCFGQTTQEVVSQELSNYWRTDYDILVRPAGGQMLEDGQGNRLVEPNALSGLAGGITLEQYRTILGISGVEVAAPVALVGYYPIRVLGSVGPKMPVPDGQWRVFKHIVTLKISDGYNVYQTGQTVYSVRDNRDQEEIVPGEGSYLVDPSGRRYSIDEIRTEGYRMGGGAPWLQREYVFVSGKPFASSYQPNIQYELYLLLAGIDPEQEDKLVGLSASVEKGRALQANDIPHIETLGAGVDPGVSQYVAVPVLVSANSYRQIEVSVNAYELHVPPEDNLPEKLATEGRSYLRGLESQFISENKAGSVTDYFVESFRLALDNRTPFVFTSAQDYTLPAPITYQELPPMSGYAFTLEAIPTGYSTRSPISGVPLEPSETSYRLQQQRNFPIPALGPDEQAPYGSLQPVGIFNLEALPRNPLNAVPQELYTPPLVTLRFDEQGQPTEPLQIHPTNNPTGYLMDPPFLLTTLEGAQFLSQQEDFISAIRVRVSGVEQISEESQTRIEQVAAEIERLTGLEADITLGSSPQPVLVHVPGYEQAPGLGYVEEGWIRQLTAITLLRQTNWADLGLFVAISLVFGSYLVATNWLAILGQWHSLGLVSALGWRTNEVSKRILSRAALDGLLAALVTAGLSVALSRVLGLSLPVGRLAAALPLGILLYVGAAWFPTRQAIKQMPVAAISLGEVRPVADTTKSRGLHFLLRRPERLAFSLVALALASALLVFLLLVQVTLNGTFEVTLLGQHIALQVQSFHYALALLSMLTAALATTEVVSANLRERGRELALLQALGWRERSILGWVLGESALLGVFSGAVGLVLALLPVVLAQGFSLGLIWPLVLGLIFCPLVAVLASLPPALHAVHTAPVNALSA